MNNAWGFEHPVEFQGGPACLEAVEEALTRAEDHRVQLKIDLVDKACCDRLPGARGSPAIDIERPPAAAGAWVYAAPIRR